MSRNDRHARSFGRERLRNGASEPTARAVDDGDLSSEPQIQIRIAYGREEVL